MSNGKQKTSRRENEAERARENEAEYIGALITAINDGENIKYTVEADDFANEENGRIYAEIIRQYKNGIKPNTGTLKTELFDKLPEAKRIKISYISELDHYVSASMLHYHEGKIIEYSKNRLFVKALQTAFNQYEQQGDTDAIIKNLIKPFNELLSIRNETEIKTAAELLKIQFPEIKWIIPGLIGEGLTMFCGAPKIGKSWFVLNLAIAAAAGGGFLGTLKANKTETLYLALEDTERRLQSRIKKLTTTEMPLNSLRITTQWRESYIGLENYLRANTRIGLVIIDTLARFANIEDMNDYTVTTNAMARLKRIADDLKIAIVFIHHAKKQGSGSEGADWIETALGSTGLTGATDSTILISRDRTRKETKNTAFLFVTGRDAADIKHELIFDLDCKGWTIKTKSDDAITAEKNKTTNNGTSKKTATQYGKELGLI